jgi:class 3 adenylate cyclase
MQNDKAPEHRLALCERELALALEIDRLRDQIIDEPRSVLADIVQTVVQAVQADAGLLALSDDLPAAQWSAVSDPQGLIADLDRAALSRLVEAATALQGASGLEPGRPLQAHGIRHLLVTPLSLAERRLGCMAFFATGRRFEEGDVALLAVAASQIDSAVVHMQTWRQLASESQSALEHNRQLEAIYHVDRIRDQTTDAHLFLTKVCDLLSDTLDTELCMLGLVDEESGRMTLRAVSDRVNALRDLEPSGIQRVLDRAVALESLSELPAGDALLGPELSHLLAAPLAIGDDQLGGLVLARSSSPFRAAEGELVQAVISQTDSALVHLRTFGQVRERTEQLEAIYRIDRIRDDVTSVQEILSAVASILVGALDADLCLVTLVSEEDGAHELRTVEDRQGVFGRLDRYTVQEIIDWVSGQDGIAAWDLGREELDHLLGSPLIVGGEKLGALVVARGRQPFRRRERDLLRAVISQTDSAIVHARAVRHLWLRNRELETLYRVDQIRDQGLEFGEMLGAVLGELCQAIDAEMGFIMLFDTEGKQLELRASTADDILATAGHYRLIEEAAYASLRTGTLYSAQDQSEWLHSVMCVPLILRERVIGVFGAVNHYGPGAFDSEDKRLLLAITSQVDTAIFESLDKQRIRKTFQRYVGPSVMEQMLSTPERDFLKGERAVLTVLFSDMRGFTTMSERVDVDVLVDMMNMHLGAMTEVVVANEGTLDKFVADEVMAIFGAPLSMEDHALRAVQTAVQMQAVHQDLVREWAQRGYRLPGIGIGISTGEMAVGNIGCEQQMDYTVIGDVVNLGSRLCDAAAEGQILIAQRTYAQVARAVHTEELPRIQVQGKEEPVQIHQVLGLR